MTSPKGKGKLPDRSRTRKPAITNSSGKPTQRTAVKAKSQQRVETNKKDAKVQADGLTKQKTIAASRRIVNHTRSDGTCLFSFIPPARWRSGTPTPGPG